MVIVSRLSLTYGRAQAFSQGLVARARVALHVLVCPVLHTLAKRLLRRRFVVFLAHGSALVLAVGIEGLVAETLLGGQTVVRLDARLANAVFFVVCWRLGTAVF